MQDLKQALSDISNKTKNLLQFPSQPAAEHASPQPSQSKGPNNAAQANAQLQLVRKEWTVSDIGTNSISSVLNDPSTSTSAINLKLDSSSIRNAVSGGSSPAKTVIKSVKLKDYSKYLGNVTYLCQRYQQVMQDYSNSMPTSLSSTAVLSGSGSAVSSVPVSPASPGSAALSPTTAPSSTETVKKRDKNDLQSIPQIFFESDFALENPTVFALVTSQMNVTTTAPSIAAPNTTNINFLLQEKLSHYLDLTEVHLVSEIAMRSQQFFNALSNIQTLHSKTLDCLNDLQGIRSLLTDLDNKQAIFGLEMVRNRRRRARLVTMTNSIKTITDVKSSQPMIQILLNQGDYVGALDLITETMSVLRGAQTTVTPATNNAPSKVIQLQGVRGIMHLGGQLNEMQKMISSLMENDFVSLCSAYAQNATVSSELSEWSNSVLTSTPAPGLALINKAIMTADDEDFKIRITPLVSGIIKTGHFDATLQTLKDQLLKTVKNLTKQNIPGADEKEKPLPGVSQNMSQDGQDSLLAKRFRALSYDAFMTLVGALFVSLLQLLKKVALLNAMMVAIAKDFEARGILYGEETDRSSSSLKYQQVTQDVEDLLYAIADLSHVRCGKLLTLRAEQNSQLNSKDFFRLFDMAFRFINVGEQMCQKNCIGLRGTMITQAKSFLNYFHMEHMKQLSISVDHEQWILADVPVDFQLIVNKIAKSNAMPTDIPSSRSETAVADLDKDDEDSKERRENGVPSYVLLDGHTFRVVSCALIFAKMIDDYLAITAMIPSLAPDVLNRVLEIVKFFNTRVCGAIVGGTAVQTSNLKSITAKHLALASQSLIFIATLIPKIKVSLDEVLPVKQQALTAEFERIREDYMNNRSQVLNRIVMIMEDRVQSHCEIMSTFDFDAINHSEKSEANAYIKNLVKETIKLHKILLKFVFPETMKNLFHQIFGIYDKYIQEQISHIDLYSANAKTRLLNDIQSYINTLSALQHVDGPGNHLEVIVNNLRIKEKRANAATSAYNLGTSAATPASHSAQAQNAAASINNQQNQGTSSKKLTSTISSSFTSFGKFMQSKSDLPVPTNTAPATSASSSTTNFFGAFSDKPKANGNVSATGAVDKPLPKPV